MDTAALPHAHGPEKAILSMLMRDYYTASAQLDDLNFDPKMFYSQSHQIMAMVLNEMSSESIEFELTVFVQKLIDKSLLDHVGGPAAITEILGYAHSLNALESLCMSVKAKYIEREVIKLGALNAQMDVSSIDDAIGLLAQNNSVISSLEDTLHRATDTSVGASLKSIMGKFEQLVMASDPTSLYGHLTGFSRIDSMIKGLNPAEVFIVGARPSMGKTAFMMNVVDSVCVTQGQPTLIFSCEMSKEALLQRAVFGRAEFIYNKMYNQQKYIPSKSELIKIKNSFNFYGNAPLHIDDRSALTIDEMRSKATSFKKKHGIKFIAIDYLQLLRSNSKKAQFSKEVEISEISAGIKSIAKDLGVSIMVLSQLNRASAGSKGTSLPKMADLRNSGSIEQDADIIGLLHRFDYENSGERIGQAQINIAKNRNGETSIVPLTWIPEVQRFSDRIELTSET